MKNKDYYTIEEVLSILILGTNAKEKEEVLASMIHAMNVKLDHLIGTLENAKLIKGDLELWQLENLWKLLKL